ncbi:unnamed protein product [Sphenostylis stenocarpa]|uniref:Uncharacterized protein n=1 Tax=Sphenostylis stenocarpa TaxID=92480 RepID=A0AA86T7L9_9FABA|nr:unnamed protein product [Sphenostylis stenocarpa]
MVNMRTAGIVKIGPLLGTPEAGRVSAQTNDRLLFVTYSRFNKQYGSPKQINVDLELGRNSLGVNAYGLVWCVEDCNKLSQIGSCLSLLHDILSSNIASVRDFNLWFRN